MKRFRDIAAPVVREMRVGATGIAPRRVIPVIAGTSSSNAACQRRTEALASGFLPGAGQLLQRRPLAAAIQFAIVITYLVIGARVGLGHSTLFAFAWNCYSVVDAYRHATD